MYEQKDMLRAFLHEPKWLLVVLDACRYDYFTEHYDAEPVRSPALNTPQWLKKTWSVTYNGTYLSGTPWIRRAYDGTNHFKKVIDVWDFGWSRTLGTVPPENIVKAYNRHKDDKMVLHFMQPHMPYIGKTKIKSRNMGSGPRVDYAVQRTNIETVRKAYRDNLSYAIEAGLKSIIQTGRLIAVTADHGELLGEEINGERRYGHNEPDCELLRKVPWREFNAD